jgi:hypothetical protein
VERAGHLPFLSIFFALSSVEEWRAPRQTTL